MDNWLMRNAGFLVIVWNSDTEVNSNENRRSGGEVE